MSREKRKTTTSEQSDSISRRGLFKGAVAVAAAGTAGFTAKARAAEGKVTKDIAYYSEYPDYENYARCGRCEHYVEGGHCKVVDGPVSAWGVCNLFRRHHQGLAYGQRY